MQKKELRVALLGTGFHGQSALERLLPGRSLLRPPLEKIRRSLVCPDEGEAALAQIASQWEWEEASTDWREAILTRKDIDAVDICLPNYLHAPAAIAAAEAGKIILCEKPLATLSRRSPRHGAGRARGPHSRLVQLPPSPGRRLRRIN